jgi:hypothetical protein
MRTLTLKSNLEHKANGPFIAGEDMVSFRQGKEIAKGQTAFLLEGHICVNQRDAIELHAVLNKDEILGE